MRFSDAKIGAHFNNQSKYGNKWSPPPSQIIVAMEKEKGKKRKEREPKKKMKKKKKAQYRKRYCF